MRKLFKFRADFKENNLPDFIYAENIYDSVRRWSQLIKENSSSSQFYSELSSVVEAHDNPQIESVDELKNFYQINFSSNYGARTVFIEEIDDRPDFIAKLHYLTIEDGGRQGSVGIGYRPLVKFPFIPTYTSGEQIFMDSDLVYPGEKVEAQITIWDKTTFKGTLESGMKFEFCEFPNKPVGTGEILEIVNRELKKPTANRDGREP